MNKLGTVDLKELQVRVFIGVRHRVTSIIENNLICAEVSRRAN